MTQHVMNIMDQTGHATVSWFPDNPAEVAAARIQYDAMVDKGYRAFRVTGEDQPGARLEAFDPRAEQIIFMPQLKGG